MVALKPTSRYRARRLGRSARRSLSARVRKRRNLRVDWRKHRAELVSLEQHQKDTLRLKEKAVLDWMLGRDGRKLKEVAGWIDISPGEASKIRYKLLGKALTVAV